MTYISKRISENEYHVIELKSQKIVYVTANGKDARKTAHRLNAGGGFAGDTPDFFNKVVALAA